MPTWAPFGLQFYCNGHNALARSPAQGGTDFLQQDNAFLRIAAIERAQALADAFSPDELHRRLDRYAQWLCPVLDVSGQTCQWSIRQAEYSTDPMFRRVLSSLDDPSAGERDLQRLRQPRVGANPGIKGVNLFDAAEQALLRTLQDGKFTIHGWRRADMLAHLNISRSAMSRQPKRFHVLGPTRMVSHTHRYYLTRLGRAAIAAACALTRFHIVPAMAATH